MSDIVIKQGATFRRTYRWGAPPFIYKAATVTQNIPVTLAATAHGLAGDWPATIFDPAEGAPIAGCASIIATVKDVNTLEFNPIVDTDLEIGTAVTVRYLTPVNITGYTAEMQIRTSARAAAPVLTLTSASGQIVLTPAANTIVVTISAAATAALAISNGVFQLEVTDVAGEVTRLDEGSVTISREVVRV